MAYTRRYRRYARRSLRRASRFARYTRRFQNNQLAVLQQRDAASFTIKLRLLKDLQVDAGQTFATKVMNVWEELSKDPQFTALTSLFDQVRIKGVAVNAICTFNGGNADQRSVAVYAWDRNGIEAFQSHQQRYEAICTYGSSRQIPLSANGGNRFRTYIVAQDLQERSQYISTDDMSLVSTFSTVSESFFKPVFALGVYQPYTVQGANTNYLWQYEVSVDLALRGTRYSVPIADPPAQQ